MKSSLRKKFLLAICSLFLCNTNIFPAITKGTLVHTPSGFVPVENLHIGDFVIGYCLDCKNLVQSPIIKIKKKKIDTLFLVKTDNKELLVSKQHLFFDPTKHLWIKAKSLTNKNYLAACSFDGNHLTLFRLRCHGVTTLKQSVNTYEIGLKFPHTFLVSQSQILTHNFAFTLGAYLSFGLGKITLESVALGIATLGLALLGKKSKNKTHIIFNPCNFNNFSNKKPDDNNDKKKKKNEKAPGRPTEKDGFKAPKGKTREKIQKVKHQKTNQWGYIDAYGNIWVPTGEGPLAHGGPHWDVINRAGYRIMNIVPGGKII